MRYFLFPLLLFIGCTAPLTDSATDSADRPQSGFIASEYNALSGLNMGPRETGSYLFNGICDDQDFFSSIAPVSSDGLVSSDKKHTIFRYYQTYRDVPVWNTKIDILWDNKFRTPVRASLLIVDPTKFLNLETEAVISPDEALIKIEDLFLAADKAENYEIAEPTSIYYYHPATNQWHYGWGSTVISHHSGYSFHSGELILFNLVYTIIIDAITGDQLLVEFD